MHPILERQILKTIGNTQNASPELKKLLELIDQTYVHSDDDRKFIEHSLEISSQELLTKNLELQNRLKLISSNENAINQLVDTKLAMLNILEDIQEEKIRTEAFSQELIKFKAALDGTSDHVIITDENGIIIYANSAIEKITGFTPNEVIGKKAGIKELWGGNMDRKFYERMWQAIKIDKHSFVGELNNKRKDGSSYLATTSISPIVNKKGEVAFFIGIERDITKEKEIDKAKTEFISLASHQLRTPLSTINWYIEMLLSGDAGVPNNEQKELLTEAYNGGKRMGELINALLNVSRIETNNFMIEPKPIDVVSLAQTILNESKPMIDEKKLKINLKVESIPIIQLDPNLSTIIFQNLFTNAIKYSRVNGAINIDIKIIKSGDKADDESILIDSLLIQIRDNGIGIPHSQQSEIFKKLFRADNAKKSDSDGTGLGLYLVKSIIEHNQGKIWFKSSENIGTTFYVTIPLTGMVKKEGTKKLDVKL